MLIPMLQVDLPGCSPLQTDKGMRLEGCVLNAHEIVFELSKVMTEVKFTPSRTEELMIAVVSAH